MALPLQRHSLTRLTGPTRKTTMPTLYLASYKGTRTGLNGVMNRLIRWATKSAYSHTEICMGHPFESEVGCLSSVKTEGGVRLKRMRLNPDKWDVVPVHGIDDGAVWHFLSAHAGSGYDLIGTVRTVLPFVGREHPTKWFCSEVAAQVIGIKDPWRMHPGVLHAVQISRRA